MIPVTETSVSYVWVIVRPEGVYWVGIADDERDAWTVGLGWPSESEIDDHKERGWYAAPATLTWRKPDE